MTSVFPYILAPSLTCCAARSPPPPPSWARLRAHRGRRGSVPSSTGRYRSPLRYIASRLFVVFMHPSVVPRETDATGPEPSRLLMVSRVNNRELTTPSTAISSFLGWPENVPGDLPPYTVKCSITYRSPPCCHRIFWCSSAGDEGRVNCGFTPLGSTHTASCGQTAYLLST